MRALLLVALATLGASCASAIEQPVLVSQAPGQVARPRSASGRVVDVPPVLGTIAGRPLEPEELLLELHGLLGSDFLLVVDRLVAAHLAEAEAARLGLRLPAGLLEAEYTRAKERVAAEFAERFPGVPFDTVVRRELGLRPDAHETRLREATLRQLVTERAIRVATLTRDSAEVRLLVTKDAATANALLARIRAGEDFATLARSESIDDTAQVGGRVPFLVREERSPLARSAFLLGDGEVAGPFVVESRQVLIKMERRRVALEGLWDALADDVEASLRVDPVQEAEYLHWHLSMERRYAVELAPLADLLGLASDESGSKPALPGEDR